MVSSRLEAFRNNGLKLNIRLLNRTLRRICLRIVGRPALSNSEDVIADIHTALNIAGIAT